MHLGKYCVYKFKEKSKRVKKHADSRYYLRISTNWITDKETDESYLLYYENSEGDELYYPIGKKSNYNQKDFLG